MEEGDPLSDAESGGEEDGGEEDGGEEGGEGSGGENGEKGMRGRGGRRSCSCWCLYISVAALMAFCMMSL